MLAWTLLRKNVWFRYLALKFKEMEEKMKNEKKKDDKSEEEKDDSDQLQDIRNEKAKSSEET